MPVNAIQNHDTQTPSIRELSLEEVEAVGGGNAWINIAESVAGNIITGTAVWTIKHIEEVKTVAKTVGKDAGKVIKTVGKDAEKVGKEIFHRFF